MSNYPTNQTERLYFFSIWTIPNKIFRDFFDNNYIENDEPIKVAVAGQEINDNQFNIYWKNAILNISGKIKHILINGAFVQTTKDIDMETFEDADVNDLDYIDATIPIERIAKMEKEFNEKMKKQKDTLDKMVKNYDAEMSDDLKCEIDDFVKKNTIAEETSEELK